MTSLVFSPPSAPVAYVANEGFHASISSDYVRYFQFLDPVRMKISRMKADSPSVITLDGLYRSIDRGSEYYQAFFSRLGVSHGLWLGVSVDMSRVEIFVTRRSRGTFDDHDLRLLSRVAPHIETAWRVRRSLGEQARRATSALLALENVAFGFALVSASGVVLHANSAMRDQFNRESPLTVQDCKLTATSAADVAALNAVLHRAAAGETDAGEYVHLGDVSGTRTTILAERIDKGANWPPPAEPTVALFVPSPGVGARWSAGHTRELLGLTPREAEVAAFLANGIPTRDIASRLGVRTGSVRAHIKSILAKTNTHSQAEFLSMLLQNVASFPTPQVHRHVSPSLHPD